jgi:taurine dioxygenase
MLFEPIAGALGAEVSGVDLREPLDPESEASLHDARLKYQVLFYRDQEITPDQHKAFGRRFGEQHVHPVLPSLKEQGHPEIVVLESSEAVPIVAEAWHSDVTFERKPPLGSV